MSATEKIDVGDKIIVLENAREPYLGGRRGTVIQREAGGVFVVLFPTSTAAFYIEERDMRKLSALELLAEVTAAWAD